MRVCSFSLAGPVDLGFTRASSSPWLQLTFYRLANSSLHSFVLPAGQIFHSLPNQLSDCTHLLVWPWDPDIVRAQVRPSSHHRLFSFVL